MGERKYQNFPNHPIDTNCRKELTCDDLEAYVYINFPNNICTYFYSSKHTFTCKNNTWMTLDINDQWTIVKEIGCAAKECIFSNYQSILRDSYKESLDSKFSRRVNIEWRPKVWNQACIFGICAVCIFSLVGFGQNLTNTY